MLSEARVLLLGRDAEARPLAEALTSEGSHVEVAPALRDEPLEDYDVIVADYDGLGDTDRGALARQLAATRLRVVSSGIADPSDLPVTLRKIIERDLFGLDKYVAVGAGALRLALHRSADKPAAVAQVEAYATRAGVHPRLVEHCGTVADEFITNALYNAPVDAHGRPRFAHLPRSAEVTLDAGEQIELVVSHDGRRVGISVSDPFGSLTDGEVIESLGKCFRGGEQPVRTKTGGAGLGLYFAFRALSHLVIDIAHGKRTEMIGLVDTHATYRAFASRSKSFHVFAT